MAKYVSNGTGTFSTATIWDTVINTPTLHGTSNVSVSVAGINSATFTAANITDAITGVLIHIYTLGTSINWIVAHQEYDGATWNDVATQTIASTSLYQWANTGHYIRFTTPYTPTTTTADYQRIQLRVSATTGTPSVAQAAAGGTLAYWVTSAAHTAPTTNDNVFVVGNNGANAVTVTVDGTAGSIGDGATCVTAFDRTLSALNVATGGALTWDTVANSELTVKGMCRVWAGGTMQRGTSASRVPIGVTNILSINPNGVVSNGLSGQTGSIIREYGALKTSTSLWKTDWVSGTGTAASPLVTSTAVDWQVGDEISVGPNTSGTLERRYIITKNSSTSYVVSSTLGGAENALAAHQTTSLIVCLTRNVLTRSTNPAVGIWYNSYAGGTDATGYAEHSWSSLQYLTRGNSTCCGFSFSYGHVAGCANVLDYVVSRDALVGNARHFVIPSNGGIPMTYNGLVGWNLAAAHYKSYELGGANATFNDCLGYWGTYQGTFEIDATISVDGYGVSPFNLTFNRCIGFFGNSAGGQGGVWYVDAAVNCTFNDCEGHGSVAYAVCVPGLNINTVFNNFKSGTRRLNAQGSIGFTNSAAYIQARMAFNNPTFAEATVIDSYTSRMSAGGLITIQKNGGTDNENYFYTRTGVGQMTGTGLTDTTLSPDSNPTLRLAPNSATSTLGFTFLTPAIVNRYASVLGKVKLNAAFTGDSDASCVVELWLPGATTASASTTIAKTTNDWQVFNLAALYGGTVPLYAEVRLLTLGDDAGAYAYFGDFYNGTNVVSALELWHSGQPPSIMTETLGDAQGVWAVATSTMTTAGTVGKFVSDLTAAPTAEVVADAVWDEATSGHVGAGTFGKLINDIYTFILAILGK